MARVNGGNVAIKQAESPTRNVPPAHAPEKSVEIKIDPAQVADADGEEELEEEESEDESEMLLKKLNSTTIALKRRLESLEVNNSKKRGSEELVGPEGESADDVNSGSGTPPKRARRDGSVILRPATGSPLSRSKKRRSEELDDNPAATETLSKRIKVGLDADGNSLSDGEVSPTASISGADSLPSAASPEEERQQQQQQQPQQPQQSQQSQRSQQCNNGDGSEVTSLPPVPRSRHRDLNALLHGKAVDPPAALPGPTGPGRGVDGTDLEQQQLYAFEGEADA
jgi:hypothetical protein